MNLEPSIPRAFLIDEGEMDEPDWRERLKNCITLH